MNADRSIKLALYIYIALAFVFIFTPIIASLVFSFNSDRFPSLPLGSFSLDWYAKVPDERMQGPARLRSANACRSSSDGNVCNFTCAACTASKRRTARDTASITAASLQMTMSPCCLIPSLALAQPLSCCLQVHLPRNAVKRHALAIRRYSGSRFRPDFSIAASRMCCRSRGV